MSDLRFSIIVPSSRSLKEVASFVRSFFSQHLSDQDQRGVEVVWVANGPALKESNLALSQLPTRWKDQVRILSYGKSSVNAARHAGAREARGDILIFLDDDLEFPEPDSLASIIKQVSEINLTSWAAGGIYSLGRHSEPGRAYFEISDEFLKNSEPQSFLVAGYLILPRTLYFELGGFPESEAWGGSELSLNRKLYEKKIPILRVQSPNLIHHLEITLTDFLVKGVKQGAGTRYKTNVFSHVPNPGVLKRLHILYHLAFQIGACSPDFYMKLMILYPRILKMHVLSLYHFTYLLTKIGLRDSLLSKLVWHYYYWKLGRDRKQIDNVNQMFYKWSQKSGWILTSPFIVRAISSQSKNSHTKNPKINSVDFDCWSHGQMKSKIWASQILEKILLHHQRPASVWILGGWNGILAHILLIRNEELYKRILSFDLSAENSIFADKLNNCWETENWKFKAVTMDCNSSSFKKRIKKDQPDVIINTAVEHFSSKEWFESIPAGTLLLMQSNNMFHEDEITLKTESSMELLKEYPLSEVMFQGSMEFNYPDKNYKRFMVVGRK